MAATEIDLTEFAHLHFIYLMTLYLISFHLKISVNSSVSKTSFYTSNIKFNFKYILYFDKKGPNNLNLLVLVSFCIDLKVKTIFRMLRRPSKPKY